jgi:hypothetical protein
MNKDLYGKMVPIPEDVLDYLSKCFDSAKDAPETTEGYKRNQELRDKREISYQQLKRIKNWFDNYNGERNNAPYVLNGGDYMKNWTNQTLGGMRDNNYLGKKIKSEVLPNQFIDSHQKDGLVNLNRQSKSHSSYNDDIKITECLKRINEIMTKL